MPPTCWKTKLLCFARNKIIAFPKPENRTLETANANVSTTRVMHYKVF
jgi:hypothetical protein